MTADLEQRKAATSFPAAIVIPPSISCCHSATINKPVPSSQVQRWHHMNENRTLGALWLDALSAEKGSLREHVEGLCGRPPVLSEMA